MYNSYIEKETKMKLYFRTREDARKFPVGKLVDAGSKDVGYFRRFAKDVSKTTNKIAQLVKS
jgi:hypothetical protein